MAFLEKRNGNFRLKFSFNGRRYSRSLKTEDEQKALLAKSQVERNIELVSLGLLVLPNECDMADFFLTGRTSQPPQGKADGTSKTSNRTKATVKQESLEETFDQFFAEFLVESVEKCSLDMLKTHRTNLQRLMGANTKLTSIDTGCIQAYIDRRAKEDGHRGKIKPVTLRKEITSLYAVFQWAIGNGYLKKLPSRKGIRYPKGIERPPFQTMDEISRKVAFGGLSENEIGEMWECLFLTTKQVQEVLEHVKENARHPFIYPMFAFAAHTGARRSEMMRSQISDIDFSSNLVTIREKKRVRGMQSTRRVPLSPFVADVLAKWLPNRPNGQLTFTMEKSRQTSQKTTQIGTPLSRNQMHDHFKRTLGNSKWAVLGGWHVFRHSFCSNCAAAGVDQRIINEWVGHQTETMVRRYRHLFPNNQQKAIQSVFQCNLISNA